MYEYLNRETCKGKIKSDFPRCENLNIKGIL